MNATPPSRSSALVAWEAVTSLGESAAETGVLLRAGVDNVAPSRFIDAKGQRVRVCGAPAIPPELGGIERLAALAQLALTGLSERIETSRQSVLLLAMSERYAAGEASFDLTSEGHTFIKTLRTNLPHRLGAVDIEAFPYGRASGVVALRRALGLVKGNRLVIWGGVDTLHDWPTIEALERSNRLLTAENVDGVRPGEGAAFLTLGPGDAPGGVRVIGLGTGREPNPVGSEGPCLSLGLSAALEPAVGPLRAAGRRTNCWLLDNSHEAYATNELQNIIARFGDVLGLNGQLQMPLRELGDVGAAAVPLLVVLAAEAWRLGYAIDDTAVITGCSERGARGALLLGAYDGYRSTEMVA